MIVARLQYGLGNQLFQYAFGRYLAHKNNTELKLDITAFEDGKGPQHRRYRLKFFNIRENFATEQDLKNCTLITENRPQYSGEFQEEYLNYPNNIFIQGWWQSEKYFSEIENIIRQEFTLKNPLEKNSSYWEHKILSADCPVSLHIRRGDYTSYDFRYFMGLPSLEYYKTCLEELKKFFPKMTVFVFSDDLNWVKNNLKFNFTFEFVEGCENDFEELYLMSLCKHNIIANSSFAWWGAWLNKNPDKKVVAPSPWFWHDSWGGNTLLPQSWTTIPANYKDAFQCYFAPCISMVIYVENDLSTVLLAMRSIFSQTFQENEFIIIDATSDGSGKICRQFAQNDNVTILKAIYPTNKFKAWNMGLQNSRGDYVLFLSCKDFMFSHAAELIFTYLCNDFHQRCRVEADSKTLKFSPSDIICATQKVEEIGETSDTLDVPEEEKFKFANVLKFGLDGKKFSLTTDEYFKDVEKYGELKEDGAKKLNLLADGQINNLLCTKVFKRKFLQDNNIRFKENLKSDAELLFLAETFLQTDEIAIINRTFCGTFK